MPLIEGPVTDDPCRCLPSWVYRCFSTNMPQIGFLRYIPDRWASIHMSLCPAPPAPTMCFHVNVLHKDVLKSFSHLGSTRCRCSSYKTISFTSQVCVSKEIHPGMCYTASLHPTGVFQLSVHSYVSASIELVPIQAYFNAGVSHTGITNTFSQRNLLYKWCSFHR